MTTDTTQQADERTFAEHQRRVRQATRDYERGKAALFDQQGRPIYVDHDTRLTALERALDRALAEAHDAVNAVRATAVAIEQAEEHADPAGRLTEAELARANARALFVREDAERLPLDQLATRLRQALAGDDRALVFLLLRYGQARFDAEQQTERRRSPAETAAVADLIDLLGQARARFRDDKAHARAQRLREVSGELFSELIRNPVQRARTMTATRQRYAGYF